MKYKIRIKVILVLFILVNMSIIVVSIFNYSIIKNRIIEDTINDRDMQLNNVDNYFLNQFMEDMENFVLSWANDDEIVNYKKEDGVKKLVRTIPNNFKKIVKLWQGYQISNSDIVWIYFANEEDGGIYIEPLDTSMPLEYDCRTRDWYIDAVKNKDKVIWTEPYLDAGNSGEVIITVAKAVINDGKTIGVIGTDIKLTRFSRIIGNLKFGDNGVLMITDDKGYIFSHPDYKMLSESLSNKEWAKEIYTNESGNYIYNVNDEEMIISYMDIENVDWKLIGISAINFDEELLIVKNNLVQVASIASIVIIFLGFLIITEITIPLKKIMDTIDKISQGNMEARCSIHSKDEFEIMGNELNHMLGELKITLDDNENYVKKINENYISTVSALASAIEVSDEYTSGHCNRVTLIAKKIAIYMKFNEEQIKDLEFASLLHDIGKIGISSSILVSKNKLTEEEYNIIKKHPELGCSILENIEFLENARAIILQHHERIDGKGYPYGLKGFEISISAKILSVADAYDAMTSSRHYRKIPLKNDEAMKELNNNKGTQFDVNVVNAFNGCNYNGKTVKYLNELDII